MKLNRRWIILIASLAVAGFFVGGATATDGLFSATVAAWLQAILSVGALWSVWFTLQAQRNAFREADTLQRTRMRGAIRAATAAICGEFERVLKGCKDAGSVRAFRTKYMFSRLELAGEAFKSAPVDALGDPILSVYADGIRFSIRNLTDVLGSETAPPEDIDLADFCDVLEEYVETTEILLKLVNRMDQAEAAGRAFDTYTFHKRHETERAARAQMKSAAAV